MKVQLAVSLLLAGACLAAGQTDRQTTTEKSGYRSTAAYAETMA